MAAGTKYSADLNLSATNVSTPALYDANIDEWMMPSRSYVQTAGGLWVPRKCADDGRALNDANLQIGDNDVDDANPIPSKLTGSKVQKNNIVADSSTTVSAGNSETITVVPTSGYIARLAVIRLNAPALSSGTGNQRFWVRAISNAGATTVFGIEASETNETAFFRLQLGANTTLIAPDTIEIAIPMLQNLWFSNDNPLGVIYENNSDDGNSQSSTRLIRVDAIEEASIDVS